MELTSPPGLQFCGQVGTTEFCGLHGTGCNLHDVTWRELVTSLSGIWTPWKDVTTWDAESPHGQSLLCNRQYNCQYPS